MNAEELYEEGLRLHKNENFDLAKEFYEKAIELSGHSTALNNLGFMYDNGQFVEQDYQKAKKLYEMSTEKGDCNAFNNLGYMYENGIFVEKNIKKAIELYIIAIKKGNESAVNNLVFLYERNASEFNENDIIEYFFRIQKEERLKQIFNYSEKHLTHLRENIEMKKEIKRLKEENKRLLAHIEASPDGVLYLEALEEWNRNTKRTTQQF